MMLRHEFQHSYCINCNASINTPMTYCPGKPTMREPDIQDPLMPAIMSLAAELVPVLVDTFDTYTPQADGFSDAFSGGDSGGAGAGADF